MPNPETSPVSIAEKGKGGKERFALVSTHLPGVSLRAEPGITPDILKSTIEKLYLLARDFARRKFQIGELESQQKGPDEEIKTIAQTHDGLRGVVSEPDNIVLSVIPSEKVKWDPKLLEESLGIAYSSIAREELVVTVSVPTGFPTEKGPVNADLLTQVLTQALVDLGVPKEELEKIMATKVNPRVDEKTLEEMIKGGKVTLLEGTRRIDRTWAITVAPLRKSPVN